MIQKGVVHLSSMDQNWHLNAGTGERRFESSDIHFQPPFPTTPGIALALSGIDGETSNLRVQVLPQDVEPDEFNIVVRTWGDTVLHGVWVTWIASD